MPPRPIVGHKKQLLQLAQDLQSENLAHAYLFAGAPSLGKMAVAKWFAMQILLGDVPHEDRELVTSQLEKLIHPDLLVLDQLWMEDKMEDWDVIAQSTNVPQQHRAKAGLKTDSIGIDDVREIQQRLHETGNLHHRVCIIRGIERMQDGAANALLKILEEPPKGRIFILTTDSSGTLLPTVISRARVMRFDVVPSRDIQAIVDGAGDDASFIVHVAQGAPGTAIRLIDDSDALLAEKILHGQASGFWRASTLHEGLQQLEPLLERGEGADRFLFHLALSLRQMKNYPSSHERALMELVAALDTNAHRTLQVQKFAFAIQNGMK